MTAGKAKADYWRDIQDPYPDIKYTDITCRCLGFLYVPNVVSRGSKIRRTQAAEEAYQKLKRTAHDRGVSFAEIGMRVEMDGRAGVIIGSNSSANFDILFEDGYVGNCHPNWKMTYFAEDGSVIKIF